MHLSIVPSATEKLRPLICVTKKMKSATGIECNDIEEVFQFAQYVLHRLSVKLTNGWLSAAVLPQS